MLKQGIFWTLHNQGGWLPPTPPPPSLDQSLKSSRSNTLHSVSNMRSTKRNYLRLHTLYLELTNAGQQRQQPDCSPNPSIVVSDITKGTPAHDTSLKWLKDIVSMQKCSRIPRKVLFNVSQNHVCSKSC